MTDREKARQNLSRKTVIKQLERLSDGFKRVGDELNSDVLLAAAEWLKEFDDLMEIWYEKQIATAEKSGFCCDNHMPLPEMPKEEKEADNENHA